MRWRSRAESNSVICLLQGLIIAAGLSELPLPTQCYVRIFIAGIPKVLPQQTVTHTHRSVMTLVRGEGDDNYTKPESFMSVLFACVPSSQVFCL